MKLTVYSIIIVLIFLSRFLYAQIAETENQALTEKGKEQGWEYLFDGTSVSAWRNENVKDFPYSCWSIKDGELSILHGDERQHRHHIDIITLLQYSNFDLKFEFKMRSKSNSGIKYFIQTGTKIGHEYQILGEGRKQNDKKRTADLYDILGSQNRKLVAPGEWNSGRIVVNDNMVQHWLNGIKVLEFDRESSNYKEALSQSKFRNRPNFGVVKQGHILIQDHGGGVAFRNIRIKRL